MSSVTKLITDNLWKHQVDGRPMLRTIIYALLIRQNWGYVRISVQHSVSRKSLPFDSQPLFGLSTLPFETAQGRF